MYIITSAACASLLSGIHNVQQHKSLSLQNLGREILRHFAEPPNRDRRPLLGGEGGLYVHSPIKSNAFSTKLESFLQPNPDRFV